MKSERSFSKYFRIIAVLMTAVMTVLAVPAFAAEITGVPKVPMGETVPEFTVERFDGETFNLQETLKTKKAVVINFFRLMCPFCEAEFPVFDELAEKYKDQVEFIALDSNVPYDAVEDVKQFKEDQKIKLPMAMEDDHVLSDFIPYEGFPCTVIVDREGKLVFYQDYGFNDEKLLEEAFSEILADDYKGGYNLCNQYDVVYADELAAMEAAEAETVENTSEAPAEKGYRIIVKDQNGDPVQGVFVNFCSDAQQTCRLGTTDEKGEAFYDVPAEKYHIQIISVPDGYTSDPALDLYTEDKFGSVNIEIKKN